MAIHRIPILGWNLVPDATGRAFFETYAIKATNDLFRHLVGVLADPAASEAHGFYGVFGVPKNFVGSAAFKVYWTSTGTSGNVKFDLDYRAVASGESLDASSFQQQLTATVAAPGSTDVLQVATLTPTSANFAADDLVEFYLTREDGGGTDTLAAAITIHGVFFEYADA